MAGTLPASGAYRPCDVVGGQRYTTVVASSNGRRLAALGVGGQVQVLDAATLAVQETFTRARGAYSAVAISADGSRIAAGAELDGELDVWDVDGHALLVAADLGPTWPTFWGAVAISADGARAAASAGRDTVLVDVATGAVRRYAEQRTCCTNALVFADGDRKLASARYDFWAMGTGQANVALIDLATGQETPLIAQDDIYGADQLAVSADGTTLLTFRDDFQVWDAATGRKRADIAHPTGIVTLDLLGLSADGGEIVMLVGGAGDILSYRRLRSSDGAIAGETLIKGLDEALGWSPAGLLFGSTASAILTAVDLRTPRVLARACSAPTVNISAFSRSGARLLDDTANHLQVLDAASGAPVGPPPKTDAAWLLPVTMSPDGRWLAWAYDQADGPTEAPLRVDVADVDGGTRTTLLGATAGRRVGASLAFSADGAHLAALDRTNGTVDLFDVAGARLLTERAVPYGQLLGFTADGEALRFTSDDAVITMRWRDGTTLDSWSVPTRQLFAASFDGATIAAVPDAFGSPVTVYRSGTAIGTLPGIPGCIGVRIVDVAPGGGVVALGCAPNRPDQSAAVPTVTTYDAASGAPIETTPNQLRVFSWDGSRYATGAVIWCR